MKIKLFIFSILFILSLNINALASNTFLIYDLGFKTSNLGQITINFKKANHQYSISAISKFLGPLKIIGEHKVLANGIIKNDTLQTRAIQRLNLKKNEVSSTTQINYEKQLIVIDKKNKNKKYLLRENTQDILTHLFEFNTELDSTKKIELNIADTIGYKKFTYVITAEENIKVNNQLINTIKYDGSVKEKKSTHTLWVAKKSHIPIKLVVKTRIGVIQINLSDTNISEHI